MAIQLPRITEYFSSLVQFNFCKLFLDAKFLNLRESYSDTAYEYGIIHFSPKNTVIKNCSNYCQHKLSIFPNSTHWLLETRFLSSVLRIRIELRQKPLWKTVNFQQEWTECIKASLLQDGVPSQPHSLCPESCEIHSDCLTTLAKFWPWKEFWRTAPATKGGVKPI